MKRNQNIRNASAGLILFILVSVVGADSAFARVVYSRASGDWESGSTWWISSMPAAGDTVVIQAGHTVIVDANLYGSTTYMFLIVVGTLDLGNIGKLGFTNTSKVIVETGGVIMASGNGAQITLGVGNAEYKGMDQGNITGPSYINNGHHPSSGEGTGGCGCYTPGSIPLPIILASFTGKQSGENVTLSWATVSEINFNYFSVERSINGIDFTEIGQVEGHGNSNVRNEYSLNDETPRIGKNYYRLKSVDFDGYVEYFNVIMANYKGDKIFSIYPNPSNGATINFYTNFAPEENSTIVVYNNLGMKVGSTPDIGQNNSITFLSPLDGGVYYVKIVSNNFTKIERLVVR